MKSGSGETGSKLMFFNNTYTYVMIMNILSIVNTKQCLLNYRTHPSYLLQQKYNPIKASYVST